MSHSQDHQDQVESIFIAGMECATSERASLLARLCGDDHLLLAEVSSLLDASEKSDDFLATPAYTLRTPVERMPSTHSAYRPGAILGAYRLINEVGRGGMGVVFRAERADGDYQQQVAIKLMRRDMDSDQWAQRFVTEKQILANLNHPNIARLIDGGTTADGQPYLVMEFVEGEPIHTYCKRLSLSVPQTLALFLKVGTAVHYAHQNLVVHRDLKPDNILVTASGVPKLLDFGVARLVSTLDHGLQSRTGLVPITPEYAAPEQFDDTGVTTATDVYALGVLLYELLCGCRPFRGTTSLTDLIRSICESKVSKPSDCAGPVRRDTIRGDLDAVVLKAMHRVPSERYSSVAQLAADIDRHLNKQPVLAKQASVFYLTRKFVARHRTSVMFAVALGLVLIAGSAATLWQWKIASTQRDISEYRYQQLRDVANMVVFDLPKTIASHRGSVLIRSELVNQGVHYMDSLLDQQPDDPALLRDIALGYFQMARLQGSPAAENVGIPTEAVKNFHKSESILEELLTNDPRDDAAVAILGKVYVHLSLMYGAVVEKDPVKAMHYGAKCVKTTKPFLQDNSQATTEMHLSCLTTASYWSLRNDDTDGSKGFLQRTDEILTTSSKRRGPVSENTARQIQGRVFEDRAWIANHAGDHHSAIDFELKRVNAVESLTESVGPLRTRLVAWAYHALGARQAKIGDFDQAQYNLHKSIDQWRGLYEINQVDVTAIQNLALVQAELAEAYLGQSSKETQDVEANRLIHTACKHYTHSIKMLNKLPDPTADFGRRFDSSLTPALIISDAERHCEPL